MLHDLRWGALGFLVVLTCAIVAVRPARALRSPSRIGPRANPTSSWWLERLPAGAFPRPARRPPSSADVVVIGAGMTGCAIAYHLRELRPELECVVLDARGVAGGATGRNGGHLWANPKEAFERSTVKDLLRFIDEHDVECDLTRAGAAALERSAPNTAPDAPPGAADTSAADPVADPEAAFSALEWDESDNTNWTAAECATHLGSRAFFSGATVYADASQFFPAKVTAALLRASRAALCAPVRVLSIDDARARTRARTRGREIELAVETADGAAPTTLRCRHVVVATNGWAPELLPELAPWLRPTRNQVLMTSPIARPGPAWSGVGGVSVDEGAHELYAIARADGRVCVGGARVLEPDAAIGSTDDASLSEEVGAHLRAFLRDAFPRSFGSESEPGSWRVEAEWTGVLGFTSDGRPIVGELPGRGPGVLVAAGFCGHGMPQCYGVARSIAHMIAGEHERVDPFVRERMDPARFVSRPRPAPV